MGKTLDEGAIKIAKAQKWLYIFDLGRRWPLLDARNFDGVYASHPLLKDYPQVIDAIGVELVLISDLSALSGS